MSEDIPENYFFREWPWSNYFAEEDLKAYGNFDHHPIVN
jgi:hypothetical protein